MVQINNLDHSKVNFGSRVKLIDLNSDELINYIILGTYETNPSKNIGDEIELKINKTTLEYEIIDITNSKVG